MAVIYRFRPEVRSDYHCSSGHGEKTLVFTFVLSNEHRRLLLYLNFFFLGKVR